MRSAYSAPCRWYKGGPIGTIRYYIVPDSNADLEGDNCFGPATELVSEFRTEDDGQCGEVGGGERDYYLGTNLYPELDGSHPFGTAEEFAGLAECPAEQPPRPECAEHVNPQFVLRVEAAFVFNSSEPDWDTCVLAVEDLGQWFGFGEATEAGEGAGLTVYDGVQVTTAGDVVELGSAEGIVYYRSAVYDLGGDVVELGAAEGVLTWAPGPATLAGDVAEVGAAEGTLSYVYPPNSLAGDVAEVGTSSGIGIYRTNRISIALPDPEVIESGSAEGVTLYTEDEVIPPGVIFPFGGSAVPTGYLLCDGSAISRTTYAALFAVLGTSHGAGDGSTTFNLPDGRGKTMLGAGAGVKSDVVFPTSPPAGFLWSLPAYADKYQDGDQVTLSTTGTLPAPFAPSTLYSVKRGSSSTLQLCANFGDVLNNLPIHYTTAGSGVHTMSYSFLTRTLGKVGGAQRLWLRYDALPLQVTKTSIPVDTATAGGAVPGGGAWDGVSLLAGQSGGNANLDLPLNGAFSSSVPYVPPHWVGNWIVKT